MLNLPRQLRNSEIHGDHQADILLLGKGMFEKFIVSFIYEFLNLSTLSYPVVREMLS